MSTKLSLFYCNFYKSFFLGNVSKPTQNYPDNFDTICDELRKNANHIYTIPSKED